jgi:hypothetical protein
MPRGSKPGERRGGRQRGTPNKKTAHKNAALAAAAANPDISPLDFLLGIMRDQLRARVTAFYESPEGCARERISHLEMQDFRGGRSAAEQNELDNLKTLYPDLPLDPDDPLTEAIEAWRRVDAKGKPAVSKLDRSKPRLSAVPRPFSDDDRP